MYTTEAFIIKKEEYGEADLMLTVLSDHFGKIKVFAKGVRKNGAKLRGHCEPISKSIISFVEGRNMYRLIHADAEELYPRIRSDMAKLQTAYRCLALADEYLLEDKDSRDFFRLFDNTFSFLEHEPSYTNALHEKVLIWFESNFLYLLGLFPEHRAETADEFPFLEEIFYFRTQPLREVVFSERNLVQGAVLVKKIFQTYLNQERRWNHKNEISMIEEYPFLHSTF